MTLPLILSLSLAAVCFVYALICRSSYKEADRQFWRSSEICNERLRERNLARQDTDAAIRTIGYQQKLIDLLRVERDDARKEHQEAVTRLTTQHDYFNAKIVALQHDCGDKDRDIQDLTEQLDWRRAENVALGEQLAESEKSISTQFRTICVRDKQTQEAAKVIDQLRTERDDARKESKDLLEKLAEQAEKFGRIQKAFDERQAEMSGRAVDAERELARLRRHTDAPSPQVVE